MNNQDDSEYSDAPVDISEENNQGEIRISHTVIQHIVRLATRGVPGVLHVGGSGIVDEIAGIFTKRESSRDISVEEDELENYRIRIHVTLAFGIQLAKCADEIQTAIREQVQNMTNKKVSRVDVFIDGIKEPEEFKQEKAKRSKNSVENKGSSESPGEG